MHEGKPKINKRMNRDAKGEESEGLTRPLVGEDQGDGEPAREQWRKRVCKQKGEERF